MPFKNVITNGTATFIGFGGPPPLAIIFWYEPDATEAMCKTVCYDEDDVMAMHKRHITPGDFYNELVPSVQLVNPLVEVSNVCSKAS